MLKTNRNIKSKLSSSSPALGFIVQMKVLALYAFLFLTVHMRRVQCSFITNIAHDNCQLMCQNVSSKECPYLLKVPRAETMDACPLLLELSHRSDVDQLEVQIDRFEKKIQSNIQVGLEREEWVETLLEKHEEFEAHMRGVQDSAHKTAVRLQRRNEELEEQKIDFMSEIGRLREKVEKFGRQGCTLDGDEYDYSELLHKSLLFYEAQRSGALPSNNRIAWRGDSALYDSGVKGEDLSGGYYDAGDFLKLGLPAAYASTVLAWGFIEFRDAYEVAGEANYMLDCLRWFTDYFIKCHTSDNEFYVHVGLVDADHSYWGRPEDMTMARPAFMVNETHPGSDCVGETAAAMAAASIAFKEHDNDYAELLLDEARSLFHFADTYRGIYSDSVPEAGKVYKSNGYKDELTWAACWLYYATENDEYLEYALQMNSELSRGRPYSFAWNNVLAGVRLLLYRFTEEKVFSQQTKSFMKNWLPGGGIPYTPDGLVFRHEWGSLRYSSSTAFIALVASAYGIRTRPYQSWAKEQIGYILGDTGKSYVVGYGDDPPQRPHHRASSCPLPPQTCGWGIHGYASPDPNPHVLYGAMVGGPDKLDQFADSRSDYMHNEVALDFNAGFQSAIAGLKYFQLNT